MTLNKKLALAALVLSSTLAPLAAEARVDVDISVGPPPARVEVVPVARPGYVWAPGYWAWRGDRHAWVAGRWIPARRGYHWEPAHWVPVAGHWRFAEGRWVR
jgi:hypothetical protein